MRNGEIWSPFPFERDTYFQFVDEDVLNTLKNTFKNKKTPSEENLNNVNQTSSPSQTSVSTVDDTDEDPNYSGDNEVSSDGDVTSNTERTRKRRKHETEWKANKAKKRRNLGKSYISLYNKKTVPRREVRPGCDTKCIYKCTNKITEAERFRIFRKYWDYGDINKQRDFISRCIKEIKRSRPEKNNHPSRSLNVAFYFRMDGREIRVCRKFFLATLDISTTTITTVRKKMNNGALEEDKRGKHNNRLKLPESVKNDVRNHIKSIPRIPSHYLRSQTSREYIEGGRTIAQIYRDYVENCQKEGKAYAKRTAFFEIFNEFNISFFIPKKDQCELCVAYENDEKKENINEYEEHLKGKELSRKEKEMDKNETDNTTIVCTYDLQAALPTPRGEVSVFYYKSKLSTYNLTICDLKTNEGSCYVWHEGEGHRGAIEIATCVFQFIRKKVTATSEDISFIFYTDNCAGQQKNKYMLMMYMYALCIFKNIKTIQHKFLIKGHTQNEGDNVHSVIEKEIKRTLRSGNIYVPSQYYQIMRTAKKKAPFYEVNEVSQFIDFKSISSELGENFTTNTNKETFPFNKIKIIKFDRENPFNFYYKTSYEEEDFKTVETFRTKAKTNTRGSATLTVEERTEKVKTWKVKNAYNGPLPIAPNKKQDLMYLVNNNYQKHTLTFIIA